MTLSEKLKVLNFVCLFSTASYPRVWLYFTNASPYSISPIYCPECDWPLKALNYFLMVSILIKVSRFHKVCFCKIFSCKTDQGPQGLLLGPKGPINIAQGCSPPQELERPARPATFLVFKYFRWIISSHDPNSGD